MKKEILVSSTPGETRAALLEHGRLADLLIEREGEGRVAGRIYKGRVTDVLPGMGAAFVDVGLDRNAFLYVDDALPGEAELEPGEARRLNIRDVVAVGDVVLVQVVKEPSGQKGARVSRHVTVPGRHLVLMPTVDYVGVSRRIGSPVERERLRGLARALKPPGMGLIVRTVAEGADAADLAADAAFLTRVWEGVQQRFERAPAPALLYRDVGLVERVVRDFLTPEVGAITVEAAADHARVAEFAELILPGAGARVRLHPRQAGPLMAARGVEAELEKALRRRHWLPSGGYLVLDRTEALTAIDVNTGKYIGSTGLEDTVYRTNLEAAREIARLLRLRDIGGMIVIDFIDMSRPEHRDGVMQALAEAVRGDRNQVNLGGFTPLGLFELTRRKSRQSLDEILLRPCPQCGGAGRVAAEHPGADRMRSAILDALAGVPGEAALVELYPSVAAQLIGPGGAGLRDLEQAARKTLFLRGRSDVAPDDLRLVRAGSRAEVERLALPVHPGQRLRVQIEEPHQVNPRDGIARVEGYVVQVEGAGRLAGKTVDVEVRRAQRTFAQAKLVVDSRQA